MHDLAIIIVSIPGEPAWLRPCLASIDAHRGGIELDVAVVENDGSGAARALIESEFPWARAIACENHGFGHANNRGLERVDARHVLFLNPDTEVRDGDFGALLAALEARPRLGVLGARQVLPDGSTFPTARRFPNALRALGEALGSERLPVARRLLRERVLDLARYERELPCDWLSGSFLLVRGEALAQVGGFDDRFFLYSEETDLCLRMRRAGWEVAYVPAMTVVHHIHGGREVDPRMAAQYAWSRLLYARKHFSPAHRSLYLAALRLRYVLRAAVAMPGAASGADRRAAARAVLRTLSGRDEPPFAALTRPEPA